MLSTLKIKSSQVISTCTDGQRFGPTFESVASLPDDFCISQNKYTQSDLVYRVQKQNYLTGLILIGYAVQIAIADALSDIKAC